MQNRKLTPEMTDSFNERLAAIKEKYISYFEGLDEVEADIYNHFIIAYGVQTTLKIMNSSFLPNDAQIEIMKAFSETHS